MLFNFMMHGFLKIRKNNLCYHLAHIIWGVCLPRLRRAWLVLYGHGTWWGGDVNKDKQTQWSALSLEMIQRA